MAIRNNVVVRDTDKNIIAAAGSIDALAVSDAAVALPEQPGTLGGIAFYPPRRIIDDHLMAPVDASSFSPVNDVRDRGGMTPHARGWLAAIRDAFVGLWRFYRREREFARAAANLAELDEHLLRDLGLHRWEVRDAVRYGRR